MRTILIGASAAIGLGAAIYVFSGYPVPLRGLLTITVVWLLVYPVAFTPGRPHYVLVPAVCLLLGAAYSGHRITAYGACAGILAVWFAGLVADRLLDRRASLTRTCRGGHDAALQPPS